MATIGYATLQIIPSLLGVSDAIEKQLGDQVVDVKVAPKLDRRATEQAGRQAKEHVEKQTTSVVVKPKTDKAAAEKAGKDAGEAVAKEVTNAVRKGDIGKTLNDEMQSAVKPSAGRELAKVVVDGIADGIKGEMPRGGVGEAVVEGLADGIKQGIDGVGGEVITTIAEGVKSGNLGGAIKDAVIPAIENIGQEIRSGASTWATGIADALRSGDIQGATNEIGNTVRNTTELISDIGTTFGLQLDRVRDFGNTAATTLDNLGTDLQGVIETATGLQGTFTTIGDILGTVLPGKAGDAARKISASLASISIPAAIAAFLVYEGGKLGGNMLGSAIDEQGGNSTKAGRNAINQAFSPGMGIPGAVNAPIFQATPDPIFGNQAPTGATQRERRGYQTGGYTGSMPADKIAGVVHGGEYVIKSSSTAGIENAYPGLLDYLNNKGALPGFKSGGKVQLGNISGAGITTGEQQSMWDAVRSAFPEAILTSATRSVMTEGHADFHNAGRAIDIAGPGMGKIAAWIAANYPDSLELIHSPFGNNIKNGKNVGDGMAYYGANTMAGHRNHVHWALGRTAKAVLSEPETVISDAMMPQPAGNATQEIPTSAPSSSTTAAASSTSLSMPSSLSGLASMGPGQLDNVALGSRADGSPITNQFGSALGEFAAGQLGSALQMFGVPDAPGFLKGISAAVGAVSISDTPFGGDSVRPVAAAPSLTPAAMPDAMHAGSGAAPGPQVTYNIRTATVEDAYVQATRLQNERTASMLSRY